MGNCIRVIMQKWQQFPAQAVKLMCYPIQEKTYRNLCKENALMRNTFKLPRTVHCTVHVGLVFTSLRLYVYTTLKLF
jgi:hypothetical protein